MIAAFASDGMRRLLACVFALAAALPAHAQSATRPQTSAALPGTQEGGWREFRGDTKNAGVSHGRAPAFTRIRWRFIADTEVLNSPAVDGDSVYFGSRGGHLYAVRTKDGSKIWERLHAGPAGEKPHGFSYSAILIHRGRLYVGSEDGHLYCVSQATGDLIWRRQLAGAGDDARIWASPKTDGRHVYLGSNAGFLWAFDPESGEVRWKNWIGDEIGGSVGILGGELVVPAKDKRLHVLDAGSGVERWRVELPGWSMSAPALQLGCAFLRASGGRAVCVDLVNRSVRWSAELLPTSAAQTSVAHDGERAYVTNGTTVVGLGADGSQLWEFRARTTFESSPIVVGESVVVVGKDDLLRVLDRKTGAVVKELDLSDKLVETAGRRSPRLSEGPTIVDGVVYVAGTSGFVYAVE
jgi:outer membrane protein assembly factor BamB